MRRLMLPRDAELPAALHLGRDPPPLLIRHHHRRHSLAGDLQNEIQSNLVESSQKDLFRHDGKSQRIILKPAFRDQRLHFLNRSIDDAGQLRREFDRSIDGRYWPELTNGPFL
jgi:hypothetical protein